MAPRSWQLVSLIAALVGCTREQEPSPPAATRSQPVTQVEICPKTPSPSGVDNLSFSEAQFTNSQFDASYSYFDSILPRQLNGAEKTTELTNREGFWIGYANRLRLMKGFVLKQSAILEQVNGTPDSILLKDSSSATFRLCEFLRNVRAID